MGEPVVLVSLWQLKNTSNRLEGGVSTDTLQCTCVRVQESLQKSIRN